MSVKFRLEARLHSGNGPELLTNTQGVPGPFPECGDRLANGFHPEPKIGQYYVSIPGGFYTAGTCTTKIAANGTGSGVWRRRALWKAHLR